MWFVVSVVALPLAHLVAIALIGELLMPKERVAPASLEVTVRYSHQQTFDLTSVTFSVRLFGEAVLRRCDERLKPSKRTFDLRAKRHERKEDD